MIVSFATYYLFKDLITIFLIIYTRCIIKFILIQFLFSVFVGLTIFILLHFN